MSPVLVAVKADLALAFIPLEAALNGPLDAPRRTHTQSKKGRKRAPRQVDDLRQVDRCVWMWERSEGSHRQEHPEVRPRVLSLKSTC